MYAPEHQDAELINALRRAGPNDPRVQARVHNLTVASAAYQAFCGWGTLFNSAANSRTNEATLQTMAAELTRQRDKAQDLLRTLQQPIWTALVGEPGGGVSAYDIPAKDGPHAIEQMLDLLRSKKIMFTSVSIQRAKKEQASNINSGYQLAAESEGGEIG